MPHPQRARAASRPQPVNECWTHCHCLWCFDFTVGSWSSTLSLASAGPRYERPWGRPRERLPSPLSRHPPRRGAGLVSRAARCDNLSSCTMQSIPNFDRCHRDWWVTARAGLGEGERGGRSRQAGSCARISLLSLPGARPAGESLEGTACFVSSITLAEEEEDHAAN